MTTPAWYAPPGEYCKDHTVIEHAGRYHLFGISGHAGTSWYYNRDSEARFSHSVSTDLVRWHPVGHLLQARGVIEATLPDGTARVWREDKVWAPHCVEAFGEFYMFYTAVEHDHVARDEYDVTSGPERHVQRICVARSSDLEHWVASTTPVFEESGQFSSHPGAALRDPMVLRDARSGSWLMYVTMLTEDGRNAVGALTSEDLLSWEFARFVYLEPDDAAVITESPFVTESDGTYYLFMNDGFATAPDPLGPFGGLRQYSGPVPGWGAGENLLTKGAWVRTLIGGAPLIFENGRRIGGQLAAFQLRIDRDEVGLLPLADSGKTER